MAGKRKAVSDDVYVVKEYKDGDRVERGRRKGNVEGQKWGQAVTSETAEAELNPLKKVDGPTQLYFEEIAKLIGPSGSVTDPEERASLYVNALEESRGKEVQLACDPALSRLLEDLIHTAEPPQLISFISGCASNEFALVACNPNGSHVLEGTLRGVARHLEGVGIGAGGEEEEWVEELRSCLTAVGQSVAQSPLQLLSSRYASHVLRNLLALLSGRDLEVSPQNPTSGSGANAIPLSGGRPHRGGGRGGLAAKMGRGGEGGPVVKRGIVFPKTLKALVKVLLEAVESDRWQLMRDSAAGPLLQSVVQSLEGEEDSVTSAVATLLGCPVSKGKGKGGEVLAGLQVEEAVGLMEDRSGSHLLEVMIRCAPPPLLAELYTRLFKGQLSKRARHPTANFVVQALMAAAPSGDQVESMVAELAGEFEGLLKEQRGGVIATLLAACGRTGAAQKEACKSLVRAVVALNPTDTHRQRAVTGLLYLNQYYAEPRMSTLGCAMLQTALTFPKENCASLLEAVGGMELEEVLAVALDPGGSRVLEAFLEGGAPQKVKLRLVEKLGGHFGEMGGQAGSSHTVEKCFAVADMSAKEMIVAEVAMVERGLKNTRHGPFLMRKLGVSLFLHQREAWRRQQSKQDTARKVFSDLFGPTHPSGKGKEEERKKKEEGGERKEVVGGEEEQEVGGAKEEGKRKQKKKDKEEGYGEEAEIGVTTDSAAHRVTTSVVDGKEEIGKVGGVEVGGEIGEKKKGKGPKRNEKGGLRQVDGDMLDGDPKLNAIMAQLGFGGEDIGEEGGGKKKRKKEVGRGRESGGEGEDGVGLEGVLAALEGGGGRKKGKNKKRKD